MQSYLKKIQLFEKLNKIYTVLFSIFLAIIPFTEHFQAIPNILMGILILFFPWVITKKQWNKLNKSIFYSLIVLVAFILIGILFNGRWGDFSFLFRILLVLIVVILASPIKKSKTPIYAFVAGSFALLLVSGVNLIQHYLRFDSLKLDVGSEVNRLLMGERPYLGFIYLISFCVCLYLAKISQAKIIRRLWYIAALIFCGYIFFIAARLSMISLLIVLGISIFFSKNKRRAFIISFGGAFLLGLLMFANANFASRLTAGFEQEKLSIQKVIVLEPRSHIWECSSNVWKSQTVPLTGYGFRNTIDKLSNCYAYHEKFLNENHRQYFIDSRFNTHNQFFNFYLSSGLASVLIFIVLFFLLFKEFRLNYTTFALVLALFLFCCLENVLSRQLGAMLFGLVISINQLIRTDIKNE